MDAVRGVLRIRLGRYRGHEGPPKTASSVRDIDLLPAVTTALKLHKAQQAAERLKASTAVPAYENMVPKGGLEPPRVAPHAPQTCASASSATSAHEQRRSIP